MPKDSFLYKQVYDGLRKDILSGRLKAGEKLPTEDEIKEKYKVSAITIKKSMELLTEEGFIHRVPGRGTFVSDRASEKERAEQERADREKAEQEKAKKAKPASAGLIGLILEHVATPFGLDMLYRMYQDAEESGYKLCIRFSFGSREKETDEIRYLLKLGVEGLIIMPCHGAHYNTALLKLIIEGFPVVLIDKKMDGIPVPSVMTDGAAATRQLVEHLAKRGCEQVGLVTVNTVGTTSLMDRREGFYEGIREFNLATCRECVLPGELGDFFESAADPDLIKRILNYLSGLIELPDGIVCTEFGVMSAFIEAARQADIILGEQLKVCCIDEDYLAPKGIFITHMRQDERRIADKAMELMTGWVSGTMPEVKDYRIPAIFMQGQTT